MGCINCHGTWQLMSANRIDSGILGRPLTDLERELQRPQPPFNSSCRATNEEYAGMSFVPMGRCAFKVFTIPRSCIAAPEAYLGPWSYLGPFRNMYVPFSASSWFFRQVISYMYFRHVKAHESIIRLRTSSYCIDNFSQYRGRVSFFYPSREMDRR